MFNPGAEKPELEVGDYVQNLRVPEALGIIIAIHVAEKRATVDWDIPGLEDENTVTTTYLTSLRLIAKPANC